MMQMHVQPKPGDQLIMVLADGETYTSLDGCAILSVPADSDSEEIDEILDAERANDERVVWTFTASERS